MPWAQTPSPSNRCRAERRHPTDAHGFADNLTCFIASSRVRTLSKIGDARDLQVATKANTGSSLYYYSRRCTGVDTVRCVGAILKRDASELSATSRNACSQSTFPVKVMLSVDPSFQCTTCTRCSALEVAIAERPNSATMSSEVSFLQRYLALSRAGIIISARHNATLAGQFFWDRPIYVA